MEQDGPDITNRLSGVVSGAAIQAGSITGDVHIHVNTAAPTEPSTPCDPPNGWADLRELPVEVHALLKAQIHAAKELPYRLPGAKRPSLATVYVRQDLGSGTEEPMSDQPRPAPILDDRGQLVDPPSTPVVRVAVRPPARRIREALDGDDHLLVTGGPGQGKSTLSLHLAAMVAKQWTSPDEDAAPLAEPVVPLRLTARELAAKLALPFPDALMESAKAEYGALFGTQLQSAVMRDRVGGCRWLLLVDGLDEVASAVEQDRLVRVLAAWASEAESPYRVVLTTRPVGGAALAPLQEIGTARYELQPFDEKALREFADSWFRSTDVGYRFVRQIRAAHLDELVRVPLLATIAAIIFEDRGSRPLPDNQYELYESYLKYLYTARLTTPSPYEAVRDALLEHLGQVRVEADTSLIEAAQDWVAHHLHDLPGTWQEDLVTYLTSTGLLNHRGDDLSFLHHSFAEHLAATAKARQLPAPFDPGHADFVGLLHAARPKERGSHARAVLLHYTRLHRAEADRLIAWLHTGGGEQHLLAARLLATHTPAGADVVNAFLTTVRAWAMTTQSPRQEILAQSSRAAHHPGLTGWLAGLMRDEEAPWSSRIEAATALSTRLRGQDSTAAVAMLRSVVDGESAQVKDRLAAAEALSECGPGERQASERGLRAVLAAPSATAWNCRNAAVVIASFDSTARAYAVEALNAILDDPGAPDNDLAHAAAGLVEIGVEFHERCAEVFRTILDNRTNYSAGLHDAAIGLASLGPAQLNDSVNALTRLVTDRRIERAYRVMIADVLTELGPHYRVAVGKQLLAISSEFGVTPADQWRIASSLADVGRSDEAARLLHSVLTSQVADLDDMRATGRQLADLGPEHHEEAARTLREVANHPLASLYVRAVALGHLATLDEPHRTPAIAALRDALADRKMAPQFRCHVANELKQLGPEFHDEAAEHVLEIASCHRDPDVRSAAWRALRNLGTRFRDQASAALLALTRPEERATWESHFSNWVPNTTDVNDKNSLATALVAVLRDPARTGKTRMDAARMLTLVGRRFHRTALDGAIGLLRSQTIPDDDLPATAMGFGNLGAGPRAEFAEALRAVANHPSATPTTVHYVARAMEQLDYRSDPEVVAALRDIVHGDVATPDERGEAAVSLARAVPAELADVVAVVIRRDTDSSYSWNSQVSELAALGADVMPGLREVLTDVNVKRSVREACAGILGQLCPDQRGTALAELRRQAADEFLESHWRIDPMLPLAQLDPTARDYTVRYHRAVLDDECQPVFDRCTAAYNLAQLDKSFGELALAALRRFSSNQNFVAEEHAFGVYWFSRLSRYKIPESISLSLTLARDPAAMAWERRYVENWAWGTARLEIERSLLADRTATPSQRVSRLDTWHYRLLGEEAETVLRDVLTAVDSTPAERVKAAAALGKLAPRHRQEAVCLLKDLSLGRCATAEARTELAKLSLAERRRMVVEAERVVADETHSWRERGQAAAEIVGLTANSQAVDYLRQLSNDPRVAEYRRLEIRYGLRLFDGLDPVRALRDDERTQPAVRWKAATRLSEYDVTDRAAGARVLNAIATNTSCRPTLRWRAASALTDFGDRGRELGVAALQAMVGDEALPVLVRVAAADAISYVRPDQRVAVLRILRGLQHDENPRVRIDVLKTIGRFDSVEGALTLSHMAADHTLSPAVRLRAATAMSELRRDHRDRAAVAAREVAFDMKTPRHIRVKAARQLARWSEPCRSEALALLVELG